MSHLHRKLMHKKLAALKMDPVPESAVAPPESSHPRLAKPHHMLHSSEPTGDSQSPQARSSHDAEVLACFEATKNSLFPVQDCYIVDGRAFKTYYSPPRDAAGPIFFCHHGAGSSALTFHCLTNYLKLECAPNESVGVFLFDARGHGNSDKPSSPSYSLLSFTEDVEAVMREFCRRHVVENALYLVGHSLGGAVLTNFISHCDTAAYSIKGLVVLDIVEETAVRALSSVPLFLARRPRSFECYADAIQWHLLLHLLLNETSAAVSVVDLLHQEPNGTLTWKADLASMSSSWGTWFANLSDNFVACGTKTKLKIAKLLVLSGNDTLDKNLIIGQMQDVPKQTAVTILDFARRNGFSALDGDASAIKPRWGGKINP